ncbi:leucine-rich repeat-containing protein 56, partial [Asbolus verrucosus]
MPPNLDDTLLNMPSSDLILFMVPLIPNGPLSDDEEEIDSDSEEDDFISDPSQVLVPLEHNLRGLLVQVTGTEDLARVTQVKLRVIARDVPLQHLSFHIPALRELILDGSVLSSFRDLGSGLKNLKILKVNRCGVECLDGMLNLESLEELYAADNCIENCMPCAFLSSIKIIDLSRNRLKDTMRTLTFLTICEKLEHIYLQGNDEIWQFPKYRQTVKSLLPALRSLDGISYTG